MTRLVKLADNLLVDPDEVTAVRDDWSEPGTFLIFHGRSGAWGFGVSNMQADRTLIKAPSIDWILARLNGEPEVSSS